MPIYLTKDNKILKTEIRSYELAEKTLKTEVVIKEYDKDQRIECLKMDIVELDRVIQDATLKKEGFESELKEINDL